MSPICLVNYLCIYTVDWLIFVVKISLDPLKFIYTKHINS